MDFTRLEKQFLSASYGDSAADMIIAGRWATRSKEDPSAASDEDGPPLSPDTISITAILMLAQAIGTAENFERFRSPGRPVLLEVPSKAWMSPVLQVLPSLLQPFGRTIIASGEDDLLERRLPGAHHVLVSSDGSSSSGEYFSRRKPASDIGLQPIMVSVAHNRSVTLLTYPENDGATRAARQVCMDKFQVASPGSDVIGKLAFVLCNDPTGLVLQPPDHLTPLQIAFAFAGTPSGALVGLRLSAGPLVETEMPAATLDDLVGMPELKQWAIELKADVQAVREGNLGVNELPRGLLVQGDPGVGKSKAVTLIARHVNLPVVFGSVGRWLGTGEGHLGSFCIAMRKAFAQAQNQAPSLLIIDELDAMPARGRGDDTFWTAAVAALLEAMDGLDSKPGVIVVGLTNTVDGIDVAIRRSGRLDHFIQVGRPTVEDLATMFAMCLRPDLQDADFTKQAVRIAGATIADVDRLCRDARRVARLQRRAIILDDIDTVIARQSSHLEKTDRQRTAIHEAGHAIIACVEGMEVHRASLGGAGLVGAMLGSVLASFSTWRGTTDQVFSFVRMLLAGRAAERLVFGSAAMGSSQDLKVATQLLYEAYGTEGMGSSLRWRAPHRLADLELSPSLAREIDAQLAACDAWALERLETLTPSLLAVRDALLEKEYLDGPAIAQLLQATSKVGIESGEAV